MNTLKRMVLVISVLYGLFVLALYSYSHQRATTESAQLRPMSAQVQRFVRCDGKASPDCRVATVRIQEFGQQPREMRLYGPAQELKLGQKLQIVMLPNGGQAYLNAKGFIHAATAYTPILFLPLALLFIPLLVGAYDAQSAALNGKTTLKTQD